MSLSACLGAARWGLSRSTERAAAPPLPPRALGRARAATGARAFIADAWLPFWYARLAAWIAFERRPATQQGTRQRSFSPQSSHCFAGSGLNAALGPQAARLALGGAGLGLEGGVGHRNRLLHLLQRNLADDAEGEEGHQKRALETGRRKGARNAMCV